MRPLIPSTSRWAGGFHVREISRSVSHYVTLVLLLLAGGFSSIHAEVPSWTAPGGLRYSSVVYAKVVDKTGRELTNSGSLLAAFNGSSIAGVTGPSGGPSGKIYQLTRFADEPTVSGMTYKLYDASTDKIYVAGEPFTFVSGQNIGSIVSPVVLVIKEEQSITFSALGSKTFGGAPFTIGGISSSGLPLQYSSSDSNVAIVTTNSVADLVTDLGDIPMELLAQSAPVTVANFISYADAGAYSNSFFHRSVPGFVIQGGGYVASANLAPISAKAPITNEYSIPNIRGTVAMALVGTNRNSATTQWFINLTNNSSILDNTNIAGNPPFAVFARVLGKGLSVVDSIASLPIGDVGRPFDELPTQGVTNGQVTLMVSNLVSMDIGIVKGPAVVIVGAGTVTIVASQAGNSNYLAASPVTNTLVINKAAASVAITGTNTIYSRTGKSVVVTTTPVGLSNQVTYSGVTNLPTNAGSYPVVATITDVNYTGSGTSTLTIAKASNAIAAFAAIGTRTNGALPFAITPPTATSLLPVSVTVKSGSASIMSNVVTLTGAGTVTLAANQAASANYLAAAEVTTSFSVSRGGQSISFGPIAGKLFGDAPFAMNASASSGLPVSYNSASTNISLSGGNVTILGAGTATIVASQGGDSNYLAATPVTNTLVIGKGLASVSFSGTNVPYNGLGRGVSVSTVPAGLPFGVTYDGQTNLPVNAGSYSVLATVISPNYAGSGTGTLVVGKASNAIAAFAPIGTRTNGAPPFAITPPAATSSLPVAISVKSGPASISNNTVTLTGAGTVVLAANQSGNANYLAASEVTTSFSVSRGGQSITFPSIPGQTLGNGPLTLGATASSGLPVSYSSSSTNISIASNTVTILGAGTATITANQSGNSNWNAAASVTNAMVIAKASNTIAPFTTIPSQTFSNGATVTITPPAASSSLPVSVSVKSGPATISGNTVTLTGAGTVVLAANQSGNANYLAASEVTTSFSVSRGGQSITFGPLAGKVFGDAPFALGASASSGLPVSCSSASTNISLSGGNVTILGAGTVTIVASQAGNQNWNPATNVSQTFVVTKAAATVTLGGLSQSYDGNAKSVTATTTPTNLAVITTYNGVTNLPVNAGNYIVAATINSPNYVGSGSGTLVVGKAVGTVTLGNLSQTYNGARRAVTVSTVPAGLPFGVTYNGQTNLPVNAGSHAVVATIDSPNYAGSGTGTLVVGKARALVALINLRQTYDGDEKSVIVTTMPRNLPVTVTYRKGSAVPVNAGNYPVMATVNDSNYSGVATGIFAVARATQTITFAPASPVNFSTNGAFNLEATSSSGLPVTYSSSIPAVLAISGSQASIKKRGSSMVTASQAGNSNIAPAVSVRKIIRIL